MTIKNFQNPQLDGKSFFFPGNETGILLIHGFTATTVEVRGLGEFLHQNGYTVSGPLLPGHGTCPEDLLDIRWRDWVDSAETAYTELSKQCKRVIVGGESLGGLLSLYLAYAHPEIAGLILYGPCLQIKKIWLTPILAPIIKTRSKGYGGKDLEGHLPWQGYTVITVPAANELRKFQKVIYRILPRVSQPLLIHQARLDETIKPMSSQIVYNRAGSIKKELVWLDKSGHTLLLDIERDSIHQKTLTFIKEVSGDLTYSILMPPYGV